MVSDFQLKEQFHSIRDDCHMEDHGTTSDWMWRMLWSISHVCHDHGEWGETIREPYTCHSDLAWANQQVEIWLTNLDNWVMGTKEGTWWDEHWLLYYMFDKLNLNKILNKQINKNKPWWSSQYFSLCCQLGNLQTPCKSHLALSLGSILPHLPCSVGLPNPLNSVV